MIRQIIAATLMLNNVNYSLISSNLSAKLLVAESSSESNVREVELYALSSEYEDYISIPDELIQNYQLDVNAVYQITSGSSVQINSSGLVTPKEQKWYWKDGIGVSSPVEGAEEVTTYHFGESVISVKSGNDEYEIRINVIDYSDFYLDKVMDDYIAQNIKPDMTIEEKVEIIAKFPTSYDYNPSYSSAKGMIVSQLGGDCWASTDAIVKMANKLGLEAWKRNANKDTNAGSGHINAMVYDGKKYFELEAGFVGKAPRDYIVKERESLFSTRSKTIDGVQGVEIYQYDGQVTEELVIPSSIGGRDVISLAGSSLFNNDNFIDVTLPSTLIEIGEWAFSGSDNITEITIPESVKYIGQGAFNIANLQNINGNSKFVYENGILYDIDNDEIVSIPNAESVVIPSGCKSIGPGAAYYNSNLKRITIYDNVTEIKQGAFYNCESLEEIVISSSVVSIEDFAFYRCPNIKKVIAENETCSLGEYLFSSSNLTVYASEGSDLYNYAVENDLAVRDINDVSSVSGDLDDDGTVTASDVIILKKYLMLDINSGVNLSDADITGNGIVNVMDLSTLKKMIW